MDELKPCPFCGGEAAFDHDDNGWNWIVCKKCGASTNCRTHAMEDCRPLLAEQWNRRAMLEAAPQPVAVQEPVLQNNDEVICPACCHQFRAIPVNVQNLMLAAGFEPPFTQPPAIDRDAVIEECAKVCDLIGDDWLVSGFTEKSDAAYYLATSIRALKSKSPDHT